MRCSAIACLAGLLLSAPRIASAFEFPLEQLVWIAPDARVAPRPAVVTLPPDWQAGDGAAILIGPGKGSSKRIALQAALVAEGAAVLEAPPGSCGEAMPSWLSAASATLREALGAGLRVVIDLGCAGMAALRDANEALGSDGAAAMVAIQDGKADFLAGVEPPPWEGWPGRAPILCRLVTTAIGAPETSERCLACLLPRDMLTARR